MIAAVYMPPDRLAKRFVAADAGAPPVFFNGHYRNNAYKADYNAHACRPAITCIAKILSIVFSWIISGICGLESVASMTEGQRNG